MQPASTNQHQLQYHALVYIRTHMQAISKGYLQASGGHVHLEFSSRYQSPPAAVVAGHLPAAAAGINQDQEQ